MSNLVFDFAGGKEAEVVDDVTGVWRRLHKEELNDLYSSRKILHVMNSRKMKCAGHETRIFVERGYIVSWGNWWEGDNWGDVCVDGWKILEWISRR